MRFSDLKDYWALRGLAERPLEVTRFRRRSRWGIDEELDVHLLDGHHLFLRGDQTDPQIFNRIFVRDEYRLGERGADRWETVLDIGANVGIFACRVAPWAGRVICYEPSPANFAQLRRNTQGRAGVESVCEAIAGEPGVLKLYGPRDGRGSGCLTFYPEAGLGAQDYAGVDEVKATTLDAVFERHRIERCDLFKIDAEGAEYEILYGASDDTLSRIGRIAGEHHNVRPDDPGTRIERFTAWLGSKGFRVEIRPSRRHPNQGNFFATR